MSCIIYIQPYLYVIFQIYFHARKASQAQSRYRSCRCFKGPQDEVVTKWVEIALKIKLNSSPVSLFIIRRLNNLCCLSLLLNRTELQSNRKKTQPTSYGFALSKLNFFALPKNNSFYLRSIV